MWGHLVYTVKLCFKRRKSKDLCYTTLIKKVLRETVKDKTDGVIYVWVNAVGVLILVAFFFYALVEPSC